MSERHRAIVLRNYAPKKSKISLLDERCGKVEAFWQDASKLSAGALIEYSVDQRSRDRNLFFLTSMSLYEMPMIAAREDIYFLHHVLELCYFFIPIGSEAKSVFELLEMLYTPMVELLTSKRKKIFLSKLFILFGMTPDYRDVKKKFVYQLFSLLPKELELVELADEDEKTIEEWLLRCIASHPEAKRIKTTYFLDACRLL